MSQVPEENPPLAGFFQESQESQQAGLAGAVGADDGVNQTGGKGMADPVQHQMALAVVADPIDGESG